MIKDKSIELFLEELASKSATPGGGSAAAIMGSMAAGLISMVCNLTIGKKNHEHLESEMRDVLVKSETLRHELLSMVKDDVTVFDQVMAAYGLPKQSEEEKSLRSETIQAALKAATDVPLACAKACREVIELSRAVAERGNKNVVSDAGVAVTAAEAAFKSAALNVYVNAGAIRDEGFVISRLEQLKKLSEGLDQEGDEIYDIVKSRL
jgi:formiminotetrahydrofolate cyclodeaminase